MLDDDDHDDLSHRSQRMLDLLHQFPSVQSLNMYDLDTIRLFLFEARTLLPVKDQLDPRFVIDEQTTPKKQNPMEHWEELKNGLYSMFNNNHTVPGVDDRSPMSMTPRSISSWRMSRFDIPLDKLNLPSTTSSPGTTTSPPSNPFVQRYLSKESKKVFVTTRKAFLASVKAFHDFKEKNLMDLQKMLHENPALFDNFVTNIVCLMHHAVDEDTNSSTTLMDTAFLKRVEESIYF